MDNPFRPTKFEWEKRPVIWLSTRAKTLAGTIKPVFISGSRGSGKTTILRSLSTRQIAGDQLLKQQFGGRRLRWFGQYLQFNSTFQERTNKISKYLEKVESADDLQERIFCTYFELTLLLNFLNDLVYFQDTDFLHFKSKVEANACSELYSILSSIGWVKGKSVQNFQDARRLVRELQSEFLKSEAQFDAVGVSEAINSFAPGALIRFIREYAISSIHSSNFSLDDLDFFVLLDDCESLSEPQQVALNTYIRRTEGLAKWVICYLSDRYNSTETLIRNTTLSADDRDLLLLNEMSEADFSEFSEQVANLRLTKFLESLNVGHVSDSHVQFSLEGAFGKAEPYNALIDELMRKSTNRSLERFKQDVAITKGHLCANIKATNYSLFSCGKSQTPYIEHVVISALGIRLADYVTVEDQLSLSKTIDGKQAAAYIALCARFRLKPIYCGANYIRALSDRCIRDFLDTMAVFFDQFSGSTRSQDRAYASLKRAALSFLRDKPITNSQQTVAIVEASSIKYTNLEQLRKTEPDIQRIVLSLAFLQQRFEHDHDSWQAVRIPVRGRFSVLIPTDHSLAARRSSLAGLRDILSRLEYDRYIKILSVNETSRGAELLFSLHRRLRPFLRCGYSGPYDPPVTLSASWLTDAVDGDDSFSPEKWAEDVYFRVAGSPKDAFLQTELPL